MRVAAVIPTWCERERIARVVASCREVADEVIVSDAGSPDGTIEEARRAGARVVLSGKGRGVQLNAGAQASDGEVLLFVHADTDVPKTARAAIRTALEDCAVVGGNFKLRFVPANRVARLYALGNHLRRRWWRVYYGDSCIFVRRTVFDQLGGFRDYPIFEDQEFVARLERAGRTHYETRVEVSTSSRRFIAAPWRTLALWTALQGLYAAGVSPRQLARLYADIR